jgi:hypothetical protein
MVHLINPLHASKYFLPLKLFPSYIKAPNKLKEYESRIKLASELYTTAG